MTTRQINIDAIIRAHPGFTVAQLAARYMQTYHECHNRHHLGMAPPKDGHPDTWLQRAETAKQIAAELQKRK